MATLTRAGTRRLSLELAGRPAGPLRRLLPAPVRVDRALITRGPATALARGGTVSLGEMEAEVALTEPGPLLDWMTSLAERRLLAQDGAALVADANGKLTRRIEFSEAVLTELQLPLLSARDGKQPFVVGLKWLPARVAEGKAGGKMPALGSKRKALLSSNFRLLGLPFDGSLATEIALPTLRSRFEAFPAGHERGGSFASVDIGELRIGLSARSRPEAMAWVQKVIADGQLDDSEALALSVEMLDASLSKVLATLTLGGCSLLACEEWALQADSEALGGLSLRFAVAQLALSLAA